MAQGEGQAGWVWIISLQKLLILRLLRLKAWAGIFPDEENGVGSARAKGRVI